MAKQLAIEWDEREMRVIAARPKRNRFAVTDAFKIDLSDGDVDNIGTQLSDELQQRGLTKTPTLVAIGRGRAELRQLNLPDLPDEELPDVVRFQAVRQFAAAGEKSVVDYLPIERTGQGVEVAAAAVAPEHLQAINKTCSQSELSVERIVLRPTAAAALFELADLSDSDETILIDTLAEEVDIIVMRGGKPAFLRSVRVPVTKDDRIRSIVGEVRRSLMAARRDEDDSTSRQVVIWGRDSVHRDLASALNDSLKIKTQTIDPFELVDVADGVTDDLEDYVGRFAPLLGLLEAHFVQSDELIDFLNPRKRPEPKTNRDRVVVYSALAAAVVLLCAWLGWSRLAAEDRKLRSLTEESTRLKPFVDTANDLQSDLARVDEFLDGDVFVLGELAAVSDGLAPSGEMQMDQLTISATPRGGGTIDLKGVSKQSSAVTSMENALRDDNHVVTGDGAKTVLNRDPYDYQFNVKVKIPRESIRKQRTSPVPAIDSPPEQEPAEEGRA